MANNERIETNGDISGASFTSDIKVPITELVAGSELTEVSSLAVIATVEQGEINQSQDDILATLTPEQQEKVTELRAAMLDKFSTEERVLAETDFGLYPWAKR